MPVPRVIVFDVNETLLDLAGLDPSFTRVFGDSAARREWFDLVLRTAFVSVITDQHEDFGTVGRAALAMTARLRGVELLERDYSELLGGMLALPPHAEVPASLRRLRGSGLRLAALTNSTQETAEKQLQNAGLKACFEQVLSVDQAGRLKPHPVVYRMAAERLGVDTGGLRMVAAHNWDVTGAMRARCAGAFVARPGMTLGPLDEQPDIVGRDLEQVADRILEVELRATEDSSRRTR